MLLHRLDLMGIMVSTGSACDSKNTKITHVLRALELDKKYASGTIRISLSKDNTKEEAEKIADTLFNKLKEKAIQDYGGVDHFISISNKSGHGMVRAADITGVRVGRKSPLRVG